MKLIGKLMDQFGLKLLLIISIYCVLSVDFNIFKIPEIFEGGHKFQNLFYQLALGTIVAMPIYYLLVYRQEQKAKRALTVYLNHQVIDFYNQIESLFIAMRSNQGEANLFGLPDENEIRQLFTNSKPNDHGNQRLGSVALWDQIIELVVYFESMVNNIAIRSKLIDPDLDMKLTLVNRSSFFFVLRVTKGVGSSFPNLGPLAEFFIQSLPSLRELSNYCNEEYQIEKIEAFLKKQVRESA